MAFWGKITSQGKIFRILLLRFSRAKHRLMFLPEFHADLSRYKESDFTVPAKKHPHLCRYFAPLWLRAPKFWRVTFEFGLYKPVKFCPGPLRFAGVIREKPILNTCILRCHTYAWERTTNSTMRILATVDTVGVRTWDKSMWRAGVTMSLQCRNTIDVAW